MSESALELTLVLGTWVLNRICAMGSVDYSAVRVYTPPPLPLSKVSLSPVTTLEVPRGCVVV